MRLFTICTLSEYEKDGEKRKRWLPVGELSIGESGRMFMRLYQQPETRFYLFDKEEKPASVSIKTDEE